MSTRLIRLYFRILSMLFPGMAARFARNLLLIPKLKRTVTPLPNADEIIQVSDETQFQLWRGTGKTVLLMHGWSGSADDFANLFEAFRARDYRIVAPVPAGHSGLNPRLSHPGMFIQAIEETIQKAGLTIDVAIGHSMGASALAYVSSRQAIFGEVILIAPVIDFTTSLAKFADQVGLTSVARRKFLHQVDTFVGISRDQLNLVLTSKYLRGGVIVHDMSDKEVPFFDALRFHRAWRDSVLLGTQGLGHRRILKDQRVCERIALYIETGSREHLHETNERAKYD